MQHFAFYYLVYIPFEGKVNVKVTQFCPTSLGPHELSCPWNSPGQNTGVGSLSILQGIFLTKNQIPLQVDCLRTELLGRLHLNESRSQIKFWHFGLFFHICLIILTLYINLHSVDKIIKHNIFSKCLC